MLTLFHDISERIHVERTDEESGVVSTLHQNTEVYLYRGRHDTNLGAVVEVFNEWTGILMEASPLDIQRADEIVRANGDKLRVTDVDNNYFGMETDHQHLYLEQITT